LFHFPLQDVSTIQTLGCEAPVQEKKLILQVLDLNQGSLAYDLEFPKMVYPGFLFLANFLFLKTFLKKPYLYVV